MDGIICLEATGGSGAAAAVHRFNMDGKLTIVAFDNDPETLGAVRKQAQQDQGQKREPERDSDDGQTYSL